MLFNILWRLAFLKLLLSEGVKSLVRSCGLDSFVTMHAPRWHIFSAKKRVKPTFACVLFLSLPGHELKRRMATGLKINMQSRAPGAGQQTVRGHPPGVYGIGRHSAARCGWTRRSELQAPIASRCCLARLGGAAPHQLSDCRAAPAQRLWPGERLRGPADRPL